ncbi:TIGR03086 family metal-binding protein [Nocardioides panacisoli]|uniref:TIGR03086 family metal-binding protein n=1 Tax=Nocardioides panacisoli TaxID=627624 RepID=UPI0031DD4D3E
MEPIDRAELYRRTVEAWNERVAAVPRDAWSGPTPCEDWTVRELVNHVTGENLWAPPLFDGATIEEVGDRFDGDLLGEDPAAAARAAADDAVAAADRVAADGTVHLSFGETPVEEYLAQLAADHLVHAWDLAAATGGDRRFDPDLVAAVASWFADREELYRSAGAIGPAAAGTTDPQDDLIARFGRDPGWQPAG